MLSRRKKKSCIINLFMACFLVAALLAGCASGADSAKPAASAAQDSTGGTAAAAPVTLKLFAQMPTNVPAAPDVAWQSAIEKGANVKIEWEIPPVSGYVDRLQVMLAGGSYPDAVFFPDPTATYFMGAVDNGIVIPISKYIDNSPNIKKYSYDFSLNALKIKGDNNIYAIPRISVQRADGFLIRKDWADKVGFTIPADNLLTADQFKELCMKFTYDDPDGNGKNDTYGWTGTNDYSTGLAPIFTYAFGDKGWQKVTGEKYEYMTPKYDPESAIYKNALQWNAELWKAGVIDPNTPSMADTACKTAFFQGRIGIRNAFAANVSFIEDLQKINPKAQLTYVSGIKDAKGEFAGPAIGNAVWGAWAVTKSCKNAEAAVKLFDYMLGDAAWDIMKYGVENSTYTVVNGVKTPTADYPNFIWGRSIVRRNNDASFFVPLNLNKEMIKPVTDWIDFAIQHKVTSLDYGYIPSIATSPALIDYNTTLSTTTVKIITGALPVSAWDGALKGWYAAGGQTYVEQMNAQIKKTQGK